MNILPEVSHTWNRMGQEFIDINGVLYLTCGHRLHALCAYQAFESNQKKCPLCRKAIRPAFQTLLTQLKRANKASSPYKQLFFAAMTGIVRLAKEALDKELDINRLDRNNKNILMYAIEFEQREFIYWFLKTTGISIDHQDNDGTYDDYQLIAYRSCYILNP